MKNSTKSLLFLGAIFITENSVAQLEPSWTVGYDILPFQEVDGSIEMEDGSLVDDAEVRLSRVRTSFKYPKIYFQGKTIVFHEISYQGIGFDYRKTTSLIDRLHALGYSLTALHTLSEKWSMLFIGKSSLASDFDTDITGEDFSFQSAAIFNRQINENLTMGLGIAYSTQFGKAEALPLLSIDWNNGAKWSINTILPSNLDIWYDHSQRVKLGFLVTIDGENFRFSPGNYEDEYPKPNLRYTMITMGPTAKISLSKKSLLNIESGIVGLHRFEFYSENVEVVSNDLKPNWYIKLGFETNL